MDSTENKQKEDIQAKLSRLEELGLIVPITKTSPTENSRYEIPPGKPSSAQFYSLLNKFYFQIYRILQM